MVTYVYITQGAFQITFPGSTFARYATGWRNMKTNEEVLQLVQEKKKSYGFDLEKEEKLDRPYTQR